MLYRLLLEHLTIVLENSGIECDRNRKREQKCGREAAQQGPPLSGHNPHRQDRPQQRENMRLRQRDQQRRSCQKGLVLLQQEEKCNTQQQHHPHLPRHQARCNGSEEVPRQQERIRRTGSVTIAIHAP